eukprot:3567601-Rhodomonas_salina.2
MDSVNCVCVMTSDVKQHADCTSTGTSAASPSSESTCDDPERMCEIGWRNVLSESIDLVP